MAQTSFWRAVETIHDVVYFAPDAKQRYEALGLKGYWMGYMASRSAAVGTPAPQLVVALFHGFAPRMVHRALPDAWDRASRDDVLDARLRLGRDVLARVLGDLDVRTLAAGLEAAADGIDFAGKPLAAAHAGLAAPDDDLGRLWLAATVMREYRGDCHVAVLTAAGIDGCAANVLAEAVGLVHPGQREMRGWTEDEWEDAADRLRTRQWLDASGAPTDTGRAARTALEDATDRVVAAGLDREATARTITLEDSLTHVARTLLDAGAVPPHNPTGVPSP